MNYIELYEGREEKPAEEQKPVSNALEQVRRLSNKGKELGKIRQNLLKDMGIEGGMNNIDKKKGKEVAMSRFSRFQKDKSEKDSSSSNSQSRSNSSSSKSSEILEEPEKKEVKKS